MNTYRFKINGLCWPTYTLQKLPNVEAAKKYADDHGYTLMHYRDPDREFYVSNFKQEKNDD